jgi:hypothetical protein
MEDLIMSQDNFRLSTVPKSASEEDVTDSINDTIRDIVKSNQPDNLTGTPAAAVAAKLSHDAAKKIGSNTIEVLEKFVVNNILRSFEVSIAEKIALASVTTTGLLGLVSWSTYEIFKSSPLNEGEEERLKQLRDLSDSSYTGPNKGYDTPREGARWPSSPPSSQPSSPVPGYQKNGAFSSAPAGTDQGNGMGFGDGPDRVKAPPKITPPATIAAPTAPAQPRIDITRPINDRDRQDGGGGGGTSSGGNINNWGSNGWGGDKDTSSSSSSRSNNTSYNSQYNRDRQDSGSSSRSNNTSYNSQYNRDRQDSGSSSRSNNNSNNSRNDRDRQDSGSSSRSNNSSNNGRRGPVPVLLDLDGNGVRVTALSSSDTYFDMAGDGQLHRTAWAGTGDGVLAIDANGDGKIDRQNEIVFTAWSPTAKTDFEALRNVFDTNANGRLDAGDARFGQFRVVVNGVVKTLGELGIVSVDLNSDRVGYVLSDGSSIDGEARFTRADGSTGTVADVTLAYDAAGGTVTRTSVTNADLSVTRTTTARDETGKVLAVTVKTTSADGRTDAISFDDDGNGTPDRSQTVARMTAYLRSQQFHTGQRAILRMTPCWSRLRAKPGSVRSLNTVRCRSRVMRGAMPGATISTIQRFGPLRQTSGAGSS